MYRLRADRPMSASRRFAIVAPNFHPRICGVGDHSAHLGGELQRRGHAVRVFSRAPVEPHPVRPDLEARAIPGARPFAVARNLLGPLHDFRPTDVILQYTPQMWDGWRFGSPATNWLARRLRDAGSKVTLIAHELHVPWLARPDLSLAALLQRIQLAALVTACHRVFVTTSSRAELLARVCRLLGVRPPGVLCVSPNVLPLDAPLAGRAEGRPSAPAIGLFSTAAIGKRFDVALEAFEQISQLFPAATLVLIGDLGAPDHQRVVEVVRAVGRHPAKDRIRMTGRLALPDIARELAGLDLFLFPMETGANTRSGTLPAALGSGLPTVAVRASETDSRLFRHDENLVFASDMTGSAFAAAALRLLRDPALLARVGQGARGLYQTHLTWERAADQLLSD